MIKRFLLPATTVIFGCFVLVVSMTNASEISFNVSDLAYPLPAGPTMAEQFYVHYDLPVATASPLPLVNRLAAAKDRLELFAALTPVAKSQAMLDDANRRMSLGEQFIREGKINEGLVAINKAQEYLKHSYELASDDNNYRNILILKEISIASLKHRERLESLMPMMPDETRTLIVVNLDKSKVVYDQTKLALLLVGETAPQSPFENR